MADRILKAKELVASMNEIITKHNYEDIEVILVTIVDGSKAKTTYYGPIESIEYANKSIILKQFWR